MDMVMRRVLLVSREPIKCPLLIGDVGGWVDGVDLLWMAGRCANLIASEIRFMGRLEKDQVPESLEYNSEMV